MREILFRGKRVDTGEWVEGQYYKRTHFYGDQSIKHYIITSDEDLGYDQALEYYEVIPRTVGQYIGLLDKNGKKIFERDIIRASIDWCMDGMYEEGTLTVWYDKRVAGFDISGIDMNTVEVIGNIHDTPELLEIEE